MNPSDYQKTKDSFITYMKSRAFTQNSIRSRLIIFRIYWKWLAKENLEVEQVTYNELLGFMKWCSNNGASQRTIQNYIGTIKHLYEHFIREGKATKNPATDITIKGVKRKVLYHIIEPHELHALYNNYPATSLQQSRSRVILGMLVYQGLKTFELGMLEVNDINLREGKLNVKGSARSNSREMKLEAHQIMDIYDYVLKVRGELIQMDTKRKAQAKEETSKLFIGEGGTCYSFSNFMTQVMVTVRKLNPNVLNAKQIRTSVITKWLKMYNLREVQYLAGHRYISSTESYLHNDMEGLQEEVQQFHPVG
ncbi:tyrosine recombinase XerD [Fulvivirga imtechensis AK7]|uniref:Tyrosine recombinase XerD n=1 Tax=Fulvivirga imtechensis AK7 TaxID=1237149 RepID=L8JIF3_9BACT|nr:tyrosine-type recombinase/integrase [Fulvivirga imtechensis]ELR68038.1 tyrosine recombinase XerD [Fulvivirga imtechensis AK7]